MNVRTKKWMARYTMGLFVVRRLMFGVVVVFLDFSVILQVFCQYSMSIANLCFLISVKPFNDPLFNRLEIFNEFCILTATYLLLLFADTSLSLAHHHFMGWFFVALMALNILFNLATIFFKEALAVAPEFNVVIEEFYETLGGMLTDFNKILSDRGLIKPMNFKILAYMTIGMVERIISETLVTGALEDIEPKEIVDHLVMHFLAGTSEPVETQ